MGIHKTIWEMSMHTKAKHEILRRYLKAWMPILLLSPKSKEKRIVYIDGFAGPGIYSKGEEGSPVIAIRTAVEHIQKSKFMDKEIIFLFIEKRKDRAEILKDVLAEKFPKLPEFIKYAVIGGSEFAPTVNDIITEIKKENAQLAPTFAFLDPFGFAGLPITVIKELLSFKKCEVLITFMTGFVRRFTDELRENALNELYGSDEWKQVNDIADSNEKRTFLLELYKRQLKDFCGAKHVISFEMRGKNNQLLYDLVFATKHWKGLEVMKEAMWHVDKRGLYRFSDTTEAKQKYLIDFMGGKIWVHAAAESVYHKFKGTHVSVEEIHKFVITETPFIFRKEILRTLEKSNPPKIEALCKRSRKYTYPNGCILRFV